MGLQKVWINNTDTNPSGWDGRFGFRILLKERDYALWLSIDGSPTIPSYTANILGAKPLEVPLLSSDNTVELIAQRIADTLEAVIGASGTGEATIDDSQVASGYVYIEDTQDGYRQGPTRHYYPAGFTVGVDTYGFGDENDETTNINHEDDGFTWYDHHFTPGYSPEAVIEVNEAAAINNQKGLYHKDGIAWCYSRIWLDLPNPFHIRFYFNLISYVDVTLGYRPFMWVGYLGAGGGSEENRKLGELRFSQYGAGTTRSLQWKPWISNPPTGAFEKEFEENTEHMVELKCNMGQADGKIEGWFDDAFWFETGLHDNSNSGSYSPVKEIWVGSPQLISNQRRMEAYFDSFAFGTSYIGDREEIPVDRGSGKVLPRIVGSVRVGEPGALKTN